MTGLVEWIIFLALSVVAVVTAAGMLLTMSMYRAGLALMSSFVALAGLFILLDADLLAAIQIMMNVGGMLVMVLFMVMLMIDPGGEMMWDMKRKMRLPGPGAFSMSMPRRAPPGEEPGAGQVMHAHGDTQEAPPSDWTCPMHPEVSEPGPGDCPICGMPLVPRSELVGDHARDERSHIYTCPMHPQVRQDQPGQCPICGMDLVPTEQAEAPAAGQEIYTCPMHPEVRQEEPGQCPICGMDLVPAEPTEAHAQPQEGAGAHAGMDTHQQGGAIGGMSPRQHYQMMVDMAMSTAQLPWALAIGAASAAVLIVLVIRTAWPLSATGPTQDATTMVGELLLSRYMIGFEGAAFLILAGIVGAVIFGKRERAPAPVDVPEVVAGQEETYTCPMHPEIRQQGPGQCPICGMDLVPTEQAGAPAAEAETYTCPMHPEVRQGQPGQCPICGMDLVPAEEEQPADRHVHEAITYTCPMHPEVQLAEPGQCPICGMDLVPAASASTSANQHEQGDHR